MDATNFIFLEPHQPQLAELGHSAESYAYSDPQSAIVKLRCFAELYVGFIYKELRLPADATSNLFERLDNPVFKNAVEECVVEKLHLIRMKGNSAAHPGRVSIKDALALLNEAFFLSAWIYISFHGGKIEELPKYHKPEPNSAEDEELKANRQDLEEKLDRQSAELQKAKAELAEAQKQQHLLMEQMCELNREVDQVKLESVRKTGHEAVLGYDFKQEETRRNITMEDVFAEYELTTGQSELVEQLEGFLANRKQHVFLLKGYAGTGKTFITKGLTEYFRAIGRNYILAAPTGKAAKVIASKTRSEAYTIHKTIYSFKDIKEYRDEGLDGTETYKYYADLAVNDLSVDTVYIIDESSMISDVYSEAEFFRFGSGYLLGDFLKFVNLDHNVHHKKVIFIGDDAQLPPVGMRTSPALNPSYLIQNYGLDSTGCELTEVVRQEEDSGVIQNAINMRNALKDNVFNQLDIDLNHRDLMHVNQQDLITAYLDSCDHKINADSIVIAYSNADVAAYNRRIREEFFPGNLAVAKGDKVMAVSNSEAYGFFISNGDFGQVREILAEAEERKITIRRKSQESGNVEEIVVPLKFRDVEVGFRDLDGNPCFFEAKIIENLLYSDAPNLSSDENKALYLDFCIRHPNMKRNSLEFRETLRSDPYFNALRLKFGYAITCHKAQGSEWPNVFVKCKTHQNQLTAEYFRWLYTAITRTSNQLYLMDEPHIKLGAGIKVIKNPGLTGQRKAEIDAAMPNTGEDSSTVVAKVSANPSLIEADGDTYGIPTTNDFLMSLLAEVKNCIADTGIELHDIQHNQYQEGYIFARGPLVTRINISYNAKQRINSIVLPQPSELGNELLNALNSLKGRVLSSVKYQSGENNFQFNEPFLNQLHQRLLQGAKSEAIDITDVIEQQYSQRYIFQKNGQSAAADIYYNKKKQFTRCNPIANLSTSSELLDQVVSLITEGLA